MKEDFREGRALVKDLAYLGPASLQMKKNGGEKKLAKNSPSVM
jgi:hypothetical protein